MKAGDRIRVQHYMFGTRYELKDYTIEEFRFCLGFFESEDHRKAGKFTPLCEMYERGPESEDAYISNFGEYYTCSRLDGYYNSYTEEEFMHQFRLQRKDRTLNKKGMRFICSMFYGSSSRRPEAFELMKKYRTP